ncbi:2-oxoisovalerate dehydrogenase subunit beta [Venturia nashicola]|nr:2-oxoisovalerate dehydrogenase subunit beta [Venturia nashicola]
MNAQRAHSTIGSSMFTFKRWSTVYFCPKTLGALLFVIHGVGIPLQIVIALAGHRILSTNVWVVTFRLEIIFPFSEFLLSSLYVYLFIRFMKQSTGTADPHLQRTFYFLVVAEAFVVIMDVIGITLWYTDLYFLRLAVLPFTTALKLKVEFLILNRLTGIGKRKNELRSATVPAHAGELGEVQVESPCSLQSEALSLRGERKGADIEVGMRKDRSRVEKAPAKSIKEVGTNVTSGDGEERESLDEMERRYLGRLS